MSKRKRPTCETCPFWYEMEEDSGQCRRHAPRPYTHDLRTPRLKGDAAPDVLFPETMPVDWCGEHPDFAASIEARRLDQWERDRLARMV